MVALEASVPEDVTKETSTTLPELMNDEGRFRGLVSCSLLLKSITRISDIVGLVEGGD